LEHAVQEYHHKVFCALNQIPLNSPLPLFELQEIEENVELKPWQAMYEQLSHA
jgi:hypothetical protein